MSTAELNQGLFDAALEIGARRANTLREVRSLLVDGKDSEALKVLKAFLGVENKKHSGGVAVRFPRPAPERSKR